MVISHKHNFIFLAVSKTGSTTIRRSLDSLGVYNDSNDANFTKNCHASALEIKDYFEEKKYNWSNYLKLAFSRNPWARAVSYYNYRRRGPWGRELLQGINSFKQYVQLKHIEKTQTSFFLDKEGNCLVDFLGKLENIQEDFEVMCKKINLQSCKLPHLNKTTSKHYTEYYDDETKQIVAELYAKDIEYFGYEFED
tara:strand:+ start:947 stop:1531 length:585 start_codon:yes stop_codon:yes gene_type:complete